MNVTVESSNLRLESRGGGDCEPAGLSELCQVILAWFLLYYNDRANHRKGAKRIGIMSSNLHGFYIWELCQVISELCQVIKNSLISGVLEASELCQVIWELCQVIENAK